MTDMDGSTSSFLCDPPLYSGLQSSGAGGILYMEDFDQDIRPPEDLGEASSEEVLALTLADIEAAIERGRQEGMKTALEDGMLVQAQLQAAALLNIADALISARALLEVVAQQHASDAARALLAILQAAVPAIMAQHAWTEIDAVLSVLLQGLTHEPELRVRAHPGMADRVREALIARLPPNVAVVSVSTDPTLEPSDIQLSWENGRAKRDSAAIWQAITTALAPLGLPALEEICCGH